MKKVKIISGMTGTTGELEHKVNRFFEENQDLEVMDFLVLHSGEAEATLAVFFWAPKKKGT